MADSWGPDATGTNEDRVAVGVVRGEHEFGAPFSLGRHWHPAWQLPNHFHARHEVVWKCLVTAISWVEYSTVAVETFGGLICQAPPLSPPYALHAPP